MITLTPHGLFVPDAALYLDTPDAPGLVFVSHAHTDHCTDARRMICTPPTAFLHQMRRGARDVVTLPYGEPLLVHTASVCLMPAGHVLGSAMLRADSIHGSVVYTGDFKLRPNPFSPPVTIPRCDTLVMECTFGSPRYVFPPDDEILTQLERFIDDALADGATPVLLGYALGKAQEVLYHLTARGYDVMVHGAIASVCDAYVELGFPFPGPGTWTRYRAGTIGRRVLLTTPGTRKTPMVQRIEKRRVCNLTGWALHPGAHNMFRDCDLVLPLSDHADWNELLRFARESGARKIYTVHGDDELATRLRTMGMDAEHLADHPATAGAGPDPA